MENDLWPDPPPADSERVKLYTRAQIAREVQQAVSEAPTLTTKWLAIEEALGVKLD